ncbi:uncharacterized protein LOC127136018 [Lathyrus oleraceus]|uniref:uncharacterized protein LOC127136018 n=1 Tax=Pisum sativum TaxID=3888 RepID=UPI0021D324F8|nr:uncharacterized protein LOC127136018 [Pisum sativum]
MSQHQTTSASKTTKSTQKVSAPSMDFHDDEILDVIPLSVIPCEALDLNHPMDALASACPNQGHFVKEVFTPLSKIYPSPEIEQHSEKNDNSSSSEKDMAPEGLCSLGQTVSGKGKFVASKTANPNVAKRMKTRKGRSVDELMSARIAKKIAGVGPSKSWSKVEVKKRKVREVSESEEGVEQDVPDISPVKKTTVRKSPVKVVAKTVVGFSKCYEGLVKEFIVNIPEDIADKNSKEFCKVFVRGELEATDNKVCREITARQVKGWPIKKHLPAGKLTVKYAILHKIRVANWVPTNHISTIANTLGRFMFEEIIKHASTNAVKLPIVFPSMICGIILNQHPSILSSNDLPSRRKPALSMHYKLFEGSHVKDIVMTSAMKKPDSKVGTIAELKKTCKELGEGIRVATSRKESLEALIASLE